MGANGGVSAATEDHKPTLASEKQRIEAAGGSVECGRVCGNLAVSRALGDFFYKRNTGEECGKGGESNNKCSNTCC